jgi:aminoglycoside phosphotransferase (APT) family kinase protein
VIDAARDWLADRLEHDGDWQVGLISGGLSNLTYRIDWGGHRYVLRRPPPGPLLPRAHDMAREFRVLAALHPTAVPVPEPLVLCPDPAVLGAPFYVMRDVPGVVLRSPAESAALTPGERAAVSDRLVDVLADLHALDPAEVGLGDYGRPGGYAARQLRTWGRQWAASKTRDLPDMEKLLAALSDQVPAGDVTTVVHGDYRLDNTIVAGADIAAVLDWELSTVGDPLADLGLLLTYWHDAGDPDRDLVHVARGITAMDGFPTTDQVAERYATRTGRDLADLPFHRALGAFKLGVILEGVHARFLAGGTQGDGYRHAGPAVPVLAARGLRLVQRPG